MITHNERPEDGGSETLRPFTMLLARPTPYDVDALMARTDDLTYRPESQVNVGRGDPLSMGRSTCFRRNSTGVVFLDNDRSQDD